jgi:hypothetical protein
MTGRPERITGAGPWAGSGRFPWYNAATGGRVVMRRGLTVGMVLVLVAPALAGPKKPDYHTHNDRAGGYTVVFPGEPKESSKTVASAGSNLDIHTARVEFNGVVYSVTHTIYPGSFGDVPSEKILDGVRDGMSKPDGTVAEEKVDLDGVAGRSLRIDAGKKNAVRTTVFLSNRRLYQVMVAGPKEAVDGKDASDFLKSFGWHR